MSLMETISKNLRQAFPKMPASIFEQNKLLLSRAYFRKWNRHFDYAAMYESGGAKTPLN